MGETGSYVFLALLVVMTTIKVRLRIPSVSVSPSADIPEGSSVTLTCSSDANPPVETYTWYRRTGLVLKLDSKQRYSISPISTEHAGYYYCEAKNKYGGRNSTEVHLDVQYSPRNMFASINQSGEIVEGSSVTLTCSSDGNPPVETYTWYKSSEAETVQVGTGASITFTLTSVTAGLYHCLAHNRVGSLISTGVTVGLPGFDWQRAVLFSTLGVVTILILLTGVVCWRRKRQHSNNKSLNKDIQKQNGDQGEDYDDIQMNSIYQSLNPNTIQPDAVYQMLNPNTTQPSAV